MGRGMQPDEGDEQGSRRGRQTGTGNRRVMGQVGKLKVRVKVWMGISGDVVLGMLAVRPR